ncbi:MAG: hypothetical protein JWP57_3691 [Spirosoma sp.]|nr:hypothetical protein [Spirosoma sp.]
MTTPTLSDPNTSSTHLSLTDSTGRQRLQSTLAEYVAFLRRQPAVCGTAEQQQTLIQHVAQGHDLIKLVAAERLRITRELDHQKHEWIEVEKQLTDPIVAAMQPFKDAVEHYNREVMRVREHHLAEAQVQASLAQGDDTKWLTPQIDAPAKPKGVQLKWTFEIVDRNQVPNGYWIIDEGAIKADIAQGRREIPGVRIYEEAITTYRK